MKIVNIKKMTAKQQEESLNEVRVLKSMDCPFIIKYRDSFLE
jgi:hypothetical protein